MPTGHQSLWGASDAYERYMGRWSRKVAPLFVEWLGISSNASWMDVGCGTGILSSAILGDCQPSHIRGVDSSELFLEHARAAVSDQRATFKQGDAQSLAASDDSFDVAVSGLVLNFIPDKDAAAREMARVVRPGGTVALYVWDYAGHMQLMRRFFDAAVQLDPKASEFDDGVKAPICRPKPLRDLFERTGLTNIEVRAIDIPTAFESFGEYWAPFLQGTGSAPKYCMSLDEAAREKLRKELQRQLPARPDGEILLAARAWAAKGRVPER